MVEEGVKRTATKGSIKNRGGMVARRAPDRVNVLDALSSKGRTHPKLARGVSLLKAVFPT